MSEAEKALMEAGVRKPCVVVDWDGTCVKSAWPEQPRKWLPGTTKFLRWLLKEGFEVKIHTVRTHSLSFDSSGPNPDRKRDLRYIREMLDGAGLQEISIVMDDKPAAMFYIDDRALRFEGSWDEVREEMELRRWKGEVVKGDITDAAQGAKK